MTGLAKEILPLLLLLSGVVALTVGEDPAAAGLQPPPLPPQPPQPTANKPNNKPAGPPIKKLDGPPPNKMNGQSKNKKSPPPLPPTTPQPAREEDSAIETPKLNMNATAPVKCDPRDYVQRGYCQKYFTCNRKLRQEIKHGCSDGLFWNPSFNSIHGGVCDYLRNIENETLYEYKKDPTCVLDVAYFRSEGECSGRYYYNHPKRTEGVEQEEDCPQGLVWSKLKESCELCHMVKKADGTPCCSEAMEDDY